MGLPNEHTIEAGRICEAAVTTLRQRTYGHGTYPLVFAENKSYGFERNTLAVRREALWLCAAGLLIAATGLAVAASHHLHVGATAMGIGCVANLALLAFWIVWPTSERVRDAGDLYAAQLLDAAATLTT